MRLMRLNGEPAGGYFGGLRALASLQLSNRIVGCFLLLAVFSATNLMAQAPQRIIVREGSFKWQHEIDFENLDVTEERKSKGLTERGARLFVKRVDGEIEGGQIESKVFILDTDRPSVKQNAEGIIIAQSWARTRVGTHSLFMETLAEASVDYRWERQASEGIPFVDSLTRNPETNAEAGKMENVYEFNPNSRTPVRLEVDVGASYLWAGPKRQDYRSSGKHSYLILANVVAPYNVNSVNAPLEKSMEWFRRNAPKFIEVDPNAAPPREDSGVIQRSKDYLRSKIETSVREKCEKVERLPVEYSLPGSFEDYEDVANPAPCKPPKKWRRTEHGTGILGEVDLAGEVIYTASPGFIVYEFDVSELNSISIPIVPLANMEEAQLQFFVNDVLLHRIEGSDLDLGLLNYVDLNFKAYEGETVEFKVQLDTSGSLTSRVFLPTGFSMSGFADYGLQDAPQFADWPESVSADEGQNVTFHIEVEDEAGVDFQWFKNGEEIEGDNIELLFLSPITAEDAGTYHVVATNASDRSASSESWTLSVGASNGRETGGSGGDEPTDSQGSTITRLIDDSLISLNVVPSASTVVYAVEEQLPAELVPTGITGGGAFDALSNKIKWGPFFDNQARTLLYQVDFASFPLSSWEFGGIASFDGVDQPVSGDTVWRSDEPDSGPDASARRSIDGQSISIEVTPSSATLVYAVEEEVPLGVQVSEVNLGGEFDAEKRKIKWGPFFDNQTRALGYQVMLLSNAPPSIVLSGTVSLDGIDEAIRGESTINRPEEPFVAEGTITRSADGAEVTLNVEPKPEVFVYAVEETIPNGLNVLNVGESGFFDSGSRKIKWGPFFDNNERVLTYTVSSVADESGPYPLAGIGSFDGVDEAVIGVLELELSIEPMDPVDFSNEVIELRFDVTSFPIPGGQLQKTLQLIWDSVPGGHYIVESTPALGLPWEPILNDAIEAVGESTEMIQAIQQSGMSLYRVVRVR